MLEYDYQKGKNMTIYDSIILGAIEGFTEFLPISSTGHLIVASKFLGIDQTNVTKAYEVIIQFAAILAVIFNYKEKFTLEKIELWKKSHPCISSYWCCGIYILTSDQRALQYKYSRYYVHHRRGHLLACREILHPQ